MKLGVEVVNLDAGMRLLQGMERQAPFALALALTRTVEAARVATQQEMRRVFDRPTPFTLASMRIRPATKTRLEAELLFKDLDGQSQTRYAHQVFGGQRLLKRMERALFRIGMLAQGEQAVPGQAARLDAYGNMDRGQIVQILAWFEAFGEQGYKANMTAKTRERRASGRAGRTRGERYWFKRDKPGRGIYLATHFSVPSATTDRMTSYWAIKPVLMFVRRGTYKPRLEVDEIVLRTAREQLPAWFESAVEQALRSAR